MILPFLLIQQIYKIRAAKGKRMEVDEQSDEIKPKIFNEESFLLRRDRFDFLLNNCH